MSSSLTPDDREAVAEAIRAALMTPDPKMVAPMPSQRATDAVLRVLADRGLLRDEKADATVWSEFRDSIRDREAVRTRLKYVRETLLPVSGDDARPVEALARDAMKEIASLRAQLSEAKAEVERLTRERDEWKKRCDDGWTHPDEMATKLNAAIARAEAHAKEENHLAARCARLREALTGVTRVLRHGADVIEAKAVGQPGDALADHIRDIATKIDAALAADDGASTTAADGKGEA
jgi:hypothetical protein